MQPFEQLHEVETFLETKASGNFCAIAKPNKERFLIVLINNAYRLEWLSKN